MLSFALGVPLSFSFISQSFSVSNSTHFPYLVLVSSVLVATDPVKVFRAIRRQIGAALLLSFHPVGLRCDAPGEDFVKMRGAEDAPRALALQPSETEVPTYTPHPKLVEQLSSQIYTRY